MYEKTIVRRPPLSALHAAAAKAANTAAKAANTAAKAANTAADGVHPLLRRVMLNRGIADPAQLSYSLKDLLQPGSLKDIELAAARLSLAIQRQQRVLVVGDYDVDGATATAVAVLGLRAFGLAQVGYLVPNRFKFGYGLSPGLATTALHLSGGKPDLVITVDNGINSIEGVALLRQHQVDVVVTDHHVAGPQLPAANAIVNPNQPNCDFPSKSIAGVGVMFYLLLHLRARLRQQDWFTAANPPPELATLLDLVALGSVADLVPLDANNRILVAQGLARIRQGYCRPGLRTILERAGKALADVSSVDLGFVIAPRLNAAGRLDDISTGIECLLTDDPARAGELATSLEKINQQRRSIESTMQAQAQQLVQQLAGATAQDSPAYCLFRPDWHQGVTGLIASRLKEQMGIPVVAFASCGAAELTGSARSVAGLHIRDLLERIHTQQPRLIQKFGGHAMAAGLTIAQDKLAEFTARFSTAVAQALAGQVPRNEVQSDGALVPEWYSVECARMLMNAAPWGQQFPAPVFDDVFEVRHLQVVAGQHLKLKLQHAQLKHPLEAIAFRFCRRGEPLGALYKQLARVRVAFRLEVNTFRKQRGLQLLVEHLQPMA